MNRYDHFLFLLIPALQAAPPPGMKRLNSDEIVDALELVTNANVKAMITGDMEVPVVQKVKEYLHYLTQHAPRPFWLTTGQ